MLLLVPFRPEPPIPQASAPSAPAAIPDKAPASLALWSPNTPEYVPQYTCQYSDEEAEPEAGETQLEAGPKAVPEMSGAMGSQKPQKFGSSSVTQNPTGYGSSSFAPFVKRQPGQ